MKKVITMISALMFCAISISSSNAGSYGIGVTGNFTMIDASGSETSDGNSKVSGSYDNTAIIGSIFAEYSADDASWATKGNGITIGAQYFPLSADVSDKTITSTITPGTTGEGDTGTKSANASLEKYRNYYIELPLYQSLYVKAGYAQVDVKTNDSSSITKNDSDSASVGKYPDKTIKGTNLGFGFKGVTDGNIIWKLAYERTNFETLNLTSTGGSTTTVKADLDTSEINLSLGYRF
jgi:hypothetical protein